MRHQTLPMEKWYRNADPEDEMDKVDKRVAEYTQWANGRETGRGSSLPPIDEVAILVPNAGHASALIETLVRKPGFEYFNNADGHVYTHPFSTTYDVRYHFVTTPRGYRLEIMHLARQAGGSGFSPLHAAMWRPDGMPPSGAEPNAYPIVHLSYKVSGAANYHEEMEWLGGQKANCGMQCRSEYGLFSYWLPWSATALLWLKPRVNTRDGAR